MEAAVRWAPGTTDETHRYLLVDVAGNNITLNEADFDGKVSKNTRIVARYDKVPGFTAFDWSNSDRSLLALGLSSGDASLVKIDSDSKKIGQLRVFPIRMQRKCNSISFNKDSLLAVGLDRVRNDHCLTVYDVNGGKEANGRLCTGEAVNSVRFFPSQPQTLVASVGRTTLRLYDLRDATLGSSASVGLTAQTKNINNIAIDPLDDNYFASGGSTGDPMLSIWDRRWLTRSYHAGPDSAGSTPLMELRPAVDNSQTTTIWSIRFSSSKRGRFGALSSAGELKLYDLATYSMQSKGRSTPANFYGGSPWASSQYIARSHNVQYAYYDRHHGQDENNRVIAFDWMNADDTGSQPILALRRSREVQILRAPNPAIVNVTSRDDLVMGREDVVFVEPAKNHSTAGEELAGIDAKNATTLNGIDAVHRSKSSIPLPLKERSLGSLKAPTTAAQRTERWIEGAPEVAEPTLLGGNNLADALAMVNIHRRRCFEGYRLDCRRNREIIKQDSSLWKLWAVIGRLEGLASDGKMATHTIDLSYYGVHGVWHGLVGQGRNRHVAVKPPSAATFDAAIRDLVVSHNLPRLDGMSAKTMHKRTLALEICGWCFSRDGIEAKCTDLLEQRQYYRAIAIAFFQGHVDLSLNMLRNLTRRKAISDTGLGALLAAESLNEEQRNMCIWMADDADDPYLQSLLRYLAHRIWRDVVNNTILNLSDRLSIAFRYLPDAELTAIVDELTAASIRGGDISGILLTGLTESCMDLFESYLERTNDLQTTVLATSFTNPLYIDDFRYTAWKESYLWYMQTWRAFIERTRFTVEHARKATKPNGERILKPASRQITLRCAHCNGSVAKQADGPQGRTQNALSGLTNPSQGQLTNQARKIAEAAGTVCPKCGRHLPRCSICMLWLGTPEVTKGKLGKEAIREIDGGKESGVSKLETDMLSRFITFCASCGHGFHAHHAKHWFSKHGMCPVPDCQCLCGLKGQ